MATKAQLRDEIDRSGRDLFASRRSVAFWKERCGQATSKVPQEGEARYRLVMARADAVKALDALATLRETLG